VLPPEQVPVFMAAILRCPIGAEFVYRSPVGLDLTPTTATPEPRFCMRGGGGCV